MKNLSTMQNEIAERFPTIASGLVKSSISHITLGVLKLTAADEDPGCSYRKVKSPQRC